MSFQQGLSGLNAAATQLDVIGNNVANANTVGFKASQTQFADVFANSLNGASGVQVGIGTKVSAIEQQFSQGTITRTENSLDLAINGGGFFRLSSNGSITFARNGQFQLDETGYIVNASGARLTGYTVDAAGVLSTGAPSELRIVTTDLPPQPTTLVNAVMNLDSRSAALSAAAFDPSDATTFNHSTSVAVFDTLGNTHVLQTFYLKTAPNQWSIFATNDGTPIGYTPPAAPVPIGTVTFDTNGAIDTGATTLPISVSLTVGTGATTPFTVDLDLTGTSQYGSNFSVSSLNQDGYASGSLAGFSIAENGEMIGRYTNGRSATLGQVVLAQFANPNGLNPLGDNMWAETPDSGPPQVSAPLSGRMGALQSSAVEESNVDLTGELVSMITAQRVYQANAQTIKTQDQVLQTLVNLR